MNPTAGTPQPSLCLATPLTERAERLIAAGAEVDVSASDSGRAQRRYDQWRSQEPFSSSEIFSHLLDSYGLTGDAFRFLLGESMESLGHRLQHPSAWIADLARMYPISDDTPVSRFTQTLLGAPASLRQGHRDFTSFFARIVDDAATRLGRGVQALQVAWPTLPFDPDVVVPQMLRELVSSFSMMATRVLVLELNIARLRGELDGATSEERFQSFVQQMAHDQNVLAVLHRYPVLARQLLATTDRWVSARLEFIGRLCSDWHAIRSTFATDGDAGPVVGVAGGAGDTHRGGRTVHIITFDSGLKLVYKPRSMSIDLHIQELLTWLNQRGQSPPFRIMKVLDRGTHGWAEHISPADCNDVEELQRFYQRQGSYLALLYALEATDFHHENLIAADEHPMLIDLESFFHPRLETIANYSQNTAARDAIAYSVLRIGLLPQRFGFSQDYDGVDVSGLGGAPGQITPYAVPRAEKRGTDEMRFVRGRLEKTGGVGSLSSWNDASATRAI